MDLWPTRREKILDALRSAAGGSLKYRENRVQLLINQGYSEVEITEALRYETGRLTIERNKIREFRDYIRDFRDNER